jgi:hypothetical protein
MIFIIRGRVRYTHIIFWCARGRVRAKVALVCILAGAARMIYGVTKGLALHPWQVAFAYICKWNFKPFLKRSSDRRRAREPALVAPVCGRPCLVPLLIRGCKLVSVCTIRTPVCNIPRGLEMLCRRHLLYIVGDKAALASF